MAADNEHSEAADDAKKLASYNDTVFGGSFSNQNMHHTSREHMSRLQSVILKSTVVGGLYGALISIPSELFIRWRFPLYRAFGFRIRVFYHTIWIASAAAFHTEREVIRFENIIRQEEEEKRRQLLELSILQGVYTPESEGYKSKKA
ncbi:hypothetical protein PICMEDRAFT_70278 [Pichia membranifaciens NRRL Y-2026]|uniref:Uncharacterized protein n=1 Tax=Pichia membranifaciens NRRL Y-2026 TaxID=763406 RepID=A0A1E3NSK8_9ASCO|nr:hypothetical protein PICMEDRAFT_70278 [Pichia membranifaciens NRRL Y-2026]ODQ48658.1 hypothetical protein PICMEDRAFT_70278 [Pichia membranifaciens NRRL Y-2026]